MTPERFECRKRGGGSIRLTDCFIEHRLGRLAPCRDCVVGAEHAMLRPARAWADGTRVMWIGELPPELVVPLEKKPGSVWSMFGLNAPEATVIAEARIDRGAERHRLRVLRASEGPVPEEHVDQELRSNGASLSDADRRDTRVLTSIDVLLGGRRRAAARARPELSPLARELQEARPSLSDQRADELARDLLGAGVVAPLEHEEDAAAIALPLGHEEERMPAAAQITWKGKTQSWAEWAEEAEVKALGLSAATMALCVREGWSIEDALTKPPHRGQSRKSATFKAVVEKHNGKPSAKSNGHARANGHAHRTPPPAKSTPSAGLTVSLFANGVEVARGVLGPERWASLVAELASTGEG